MGTKSVRLDEDLYERIEAHQREDETFSEAIERLIGGYSLLDFTGGLYRRSLSGSCTSVSGVAQT